MGMYYYNILDCATFQHGYLMPWWDRLDYCKYIMEVMA